MRRLLLNPKLLVALIVIFAIFDIFAYRYIYAVEVNKRIYSESVVKFVNANKNPVFKVKKVILYYGATAVDNSDGELTDIDISQFTDIELEIDNHSYNKELSPENTVSELFIDNIKITPFSEDAEIMFNYKNPMYAGKYKELENYKEDGILFKIIRSNEALKDVDYDDSVFYTDCSNPLSLGYINKDIMTGCEVSKDVDGLVTFDGSILRSVNIPLDSLHAKIQFSIHIINNYNEEYICNVSIENDLNTENKEIYTGHYVKIINANDMNFIKVSN